MRRLLYVSFFLEVGLVLIVLPWSAFWDRNYFGQVLPSLRELLTNNFVRGGVTGLGVINVCAGLVELRGLFTGRRASRPPDPIGDQTGPR